MKRVLMVAYHFPPLAGSSGIQRTLRFVQHLPAFGWQPLVLTIKPSAYERTSPDLDNAIPGGTVVRRAFGLDTARHLSIGGRYAAWTARPDRWVSWRFAAVIRGLEMIREFKPQALWSTYPIATAHLIGAELQRRSGLPWIADFRDPMAQDGYPSDPITWQQYADIESRTMRQARLNMFTTPSAARQYAQRYPDVADRMAVLENGYDEESFPAADLAQATAPLNPGSLTLLHSGIVYAAERDPAHLFEALRRLKEAGDLRDGMLKVRFRAAVHEDLLHELAAKHQVYDCIEVCPPVPYGEALLEMMRADGLLVLQAANCNAQIPAKIYEYLRAGRPVLCLSHPEGDTEAALRSAGIQAHARLDEPAAIARLLAAFVVDAGAGNLGAYLPQQARVEGASRRGRASSLADHLDRISVPK